MVNAPANTGQNWEELRNRARSQVIDKINRMLGIDIESLIKTEQWLDPVLIEERTSSFRGSLYGTSSNDRMAAFARHANFTSYIKGLYFCGGSVHPGGHSPLPEKRPHCWQPHQKPITRSYTLMKPIGTIPRQHIATGIAILFHLIGVVGILFLNRNFSSAPVSSTCC